MNDLPRLSARAERSHKGDYGRALLIGGSRGMAGAIALAGMGALRSGAGLVTLAVPDVCLETVAAHDPCYMTVALPNDAQGRMDTGAEPQIRGLADKATAIACGPGLGRSDFLSRLVRVLYTAIPRPMVVDADALNALAQLPDGISLPGGPRILTPHAGEFDRLTGGSVCDMQERKRLARDMAAAHGIVLVLKGHRTVVTDGNMVYHNETGNPGMATGGTGDVLTGIITALLCQGLNAFDAARLGVHVHGGAGDLAATRYSMVSMTAQDLVRCLPAAWLQQR